MVIGLSVTRPKRVFPESANCLEEGDLLSHAYESSSVRSQST